MSHLNEKEELLSPREIEVWHAIKIIGEMALSVVGHKIEAQTRLSGADFGVLSRLVDLGNGEMSQRELSDSLGWEKSRLSHHLKRMEKRGLIKRYSETSSKGVSVMIEPAGKEAIALARPIHAAIVRKYVLQYVNADEKSALLKFAEQLQAESEKTRGKTF
ncbi:MarR family winged helix-turn-helix transcriptional regulator [Pantoea stewartii]|uniref:MarR family winged helix-turn-helix transcriptional regulator n=1 Tax=Pantoea stewartii TaxID=66269 RepID=UPI00197E00C8|nr:MarR family winged helix-turn-helix transcriptional regulator [Pantoea stewartii]